MARVITKIVESIPVRTFYKSFKEHLQLTLVAGEKGLSKVIKEKSINRPALALIGHFKFFANKRIQLFGAGEMAFVRDLPSEEQTNVLTTLMSKHIPCIIVSRDLAPTKSMLNCANKLNIPVFRTPLKSKDFSADATILLEYKFAPAATIHGTLLDIKGTGTLMRGKSGVGKSECALTIIERGQGEQEQARQRLEQEQEAGQELRRQLDAIGQRMEQEAGQELRRQEEQTSQRLEQESSQELRRQLDGQEQELEKAKVGLLELGRELEARQEAVRELEGRLASTGRSLRSKEEEVSSLLQTQLLAQGSSNTTELMQEKHELERQLEKVTLDMAGVEKVVTEMTRSFRHQVQSKEAEVRGERERCQGLERVNRDLELRCTDLDTAVKVGSSS